MKKECGVFGGRRRMTEVAKTGIDGGSRAVPLRAASLWYPGLMEEEFCGDDDLHGHRLPCLCTFHLDLISCHTMHATQWFDQGPITANQGVDIGFRQAVRNHHHPRQDAFMRPGR